MKNAQHKVKWMGSMALATAMLGGLLMFAGASIAKADDGDFYRCDRQVQYTAWRAHEAAEHFGYFSREARYWRHENHEARERRAHLLHEYREHREREYRNYYRDYDRDDDRQ